MDESDPNINSAQYYIGWINFYLSINEVSPNFCGYFEGNEVHNQASRRNPNVTVQYFWKSSQSLRRQSRGNCTRVFSKNATSYEAHLDQVSSLPEFHYKWWRRDQTYWHQVIYCGYFYKDARFWVVQISTLKS